MSGPYDSRDNGHSFAGLYGLSNPIVTWLIGRGQGELVALTPDELHKVAAQPNCPSCLRSGQRNPMHWRGKEWVCYDHKKPIRETIPPRLQELPPGPRWQDCIGKEVDLVYTKADGESRASWKYVVREMTR